MSRLELRIETMERAARGILAELDALRRELAAAAQAVPAAVLEAVCASLKVSSVVVLAGDRLRPTTRARHACALAMHRRGYSYPVIARTLQMGHHSTAINAVKSAVDVEASDPAFARAVAAGEATAGPTAPPRVAADAPPAPPGMRHGKAPLHHSCGCRRCLRSRPTPRPVHVASAASASA